MGGLSNMSMAAAIGRALRGGGGHGVEGKGRDEKGKARVPRKQPRGLNFWLGSLRRNSWEIALILSQTSPRRKKTHQRYYSV